VAKLAAALAVTRLEPRYPATGIQDLLLAGVEGVELEHTSTVIFPLVLVLWVSNELPQLQVTSVVTYSGWIPVFMGNSSR